MFFLLLYYFINVYSVDFLNNFSLVSGLPAGYTFLTFIACVKLRIYTACVHGDREDRMAAGSGNIANKLDRGEVITTYGMDETFSRSTRHGDSCVHWFRGSLLIACSQVKRSACFLLVSVQKERIREGTKLAC